MSVPWIWFVSFRDRIVWELVVDKEPIIEYIFTNHYYTLERVCSCYHSPFLPVFQVIIVCVLYSRPAY